MSHSTSTSSTTLNPPDLIPITKVNSKTRQLIDEEGNERYFRGMSVAYKAPPYLPLLDEFDPILSFSQVDIDLFNRLNLNIIRLPVPWAAVQPLEPTEEGGNVYDEVYLEKIKSLVERCGRAGIYVLIECHQDLYAEKFCGNGMPGWSISKDSWTFNFPYPVSYPKAKYEDGDSNFPSDDTCGPCHSRTRPDWGRFYGSDACTRAFYGLYTEEKVQGPFVAYWEKLAQTFTGMSNIIGYELINEPFIASKTAAGVPYNLFYNRSRTESLYLQPLYTRLSLAIRKYDPRTLIWWEPVTGGGGNSGEGFSSVPEEGEEGKGKSVMSFHSYGPNGADKDDIRQAIDIRLKQVEELGGGLVLTEYDCEFVRGLGRIQEVMELCDEKLLSWIGWQYKEFVHVAGSPPSGTLYNPKTARLRPVMLHLFSRPYPSSILGEVKSFHYNLKHQIFILIFIPSSTTTIINEKDTEKEQEKFSIIAINEDNDAGWGEWLIDTKSNDDIRIEKSSNSVKIYVGSNWNVGEEVKIVLKQKMDKRTWKHKDHKEEEEKEKEDFTDVCSICC